MERFRFFDENRVSLYVIGGAFFLSVILGTIRGNPGGTVLMKAFLSALLFGFIFQGGVYVLRRYIPDLVSPRGQTEEKPSDEEQERSTGNVIDYRLGAEEEILPIDLQLDERWVQKERSEKTPGESEGGEEVLAGKEPAPEGVEKESEDAVLGELPSLDHLFNEAEEAPRESEEKREEERPGRSISSNYIQIGEAHIPNEPKALAKAVKKVMNEDVKR